MKKKTVALVLASTMLFGIATGGTIAWLTDNTEKVTNTFTVGNVEITLKESPYDKDKDQYGDPQENVRNTYPAIPGATYKKNPVVTVMGGSESCYLFVEFTYSADAQIYLNYTSNLKASVWTQLDSTITNADGTKTEVWYKDVTKSESHQSWNLLEELDADTYGAGITLEINPENVTKDTIEAAASQKLEWKAYAIQRDNLKDTDGDGSTVKEAWELAKPQTT